MNVALDRLVMQNRRILFDEVLTEGKPAGELAARGWAMLGLTF
jgi:hypothetical protein